ncbi:hypothetical protein [Thermococcus sp.]
MDERDKKIIEHAIWALLLAWFSYMFFYQNYLLYTWHRGLPLPSKWPFIFLGVGVGALFFAYKLYAEEAHGIPPNESRLQSEDSS